MTREEYVFRISSLTQELTGLAAEYFSTQRDPYEVAGERFNQAVDALSRIVYKDGRTRSQSGSGKRRS